MCSLILFDLQWFPLIIVVFRWFSLRCIDLSCFSSLFINCHCLWLSLVFINLHCFSLTATWCQAISIDYILYPLSFVWCFRWVSYFRCSWMLIESQCFPRVFTASCWLTLVIIEFQWFSLIFFGVRWVWVFFNEFYSTSIWFQLANGLHWFSLISTANVLTVIDFHWFSLFHTGSHCIIFVCIDHYWVSLVFFDFLDLLILINYQWLSLASIWFQLVSSDSRWVPLWCFWTFTHCLAYLFIACLSCSCVLLVCRLFSLRYMELNWLSLRFVDSFWFSSVFISFYWFSSASIRFQWVSIDFLSLCRCALHRFSLVFYVFIECIWLSWVAVGSRCFSFVVIVWSRFALVLIGFP